MRVLTARGYSVLIALLLVVMMVGIIGAGAAGAQEAPVRHATGTFEVTMAPGDEEQVEAGLGLSRYVLSKTFQGGITAVGAGQMLAGGPPGSETAGTYVALERVVGTLDGRSGAFLLAHRGDINSEGYSLSITVVPGSGTGDLTGLSGDFALTITDGIHHYDLAYRLPDS
ncbi:DUF3224 domain-containing protein [Brevundimonas subvibrioides]|uniref:DUF3224 domain-containing protein n=1 Tax=Brevundimonas subvibrioides (strain ATCC 15264 / DSM 4735 / LMG 14903 / NBRC 16000 / CB 81) TaxID=633149 RepID=D9QJE7_BRESC|nr:DUF3224 domain-containing protein [Brevundimonas subvibrioides]ADL01508.1 Protein of unknown function DUF3224 [Brevundimonas subvibrioides ATCC 15264]